MKITDKTKYINAKVIPDNKFNTASICLMVRRPLKRGEATLNSLLAAVIGSGSAKYPDLYEINKYMEELYGAIFDCQIIKKGEFQIIRLYMEYVAVADESLLSKSVEFLKEILLNPLAQNGSFSDEIVENEKEMLRSAIEERINDKNEYARLKCVEKMCAEESFGIYADGYAEDLEKIDAKTLYCHYKNVIKSSPLEFIATGNIDEESFKTLVEEAFVNSDYRPVNLKVDNILYKPENENVYEEILNINQSKICMGLRLNGGFSGKNFHTIMLFNEILGGSGNSKLFMNLREKSSLCYNIFSFVYRFKSIVMIQSGVENKNIDLAIEKIKEQLEIMKKGEITQDELDMAKQGMISAFTNLCDHQGSMLDFYYTQYLLEDDDDIEEMIEGIKIVTVEDIVTLAKTLYVDTIYVLKGEENGQDA